MTDAVVARWQDQIREAAATGTPLRIAGGGTKEFYGNPVAGEILDTRDCAGIVDYQPGELVMIARAGTPLTVVEAALAERGQMLAFEPPHFGSGATLGGTVATAMSGPRRPYAGAVRDLMLGIRIVDGTGAFMHFGGRVMKNVAGFDVTRLMTGALGTLGVISEVAFKCVPVARSEATVAFECSADEAIHRVNAWSGKPWPLTATCYWRGTLAARFAGAAPAVAQAQKAAGGHGVDNAAPFWASVREHTHGFFTPQDDASRDLWRLAVKSTTPYKDLGGEQLVEWGGALRWLWLPAAAGAGAMRDWAAAQGGHATVFRAASTSLAGASGVFHPLAPALVPVHERLKATFDPQRILNRGRLYAGM